MLIPKDKFEGVFRQRLFIPWWEEVRLIVDELDEGVVGKVVCLTQN